MDDAETPRTLLTHILKTENPLQTVRPLKRHLSVVEKDLVKPNWVQDQEQSLNDFTPRTLISQALDHSESLATVRQKKRYTAYTSYQIPNAASTPKSRSPEATLASTGSYAEGRFEWKRISQKNVFKRIRLSELSFTTKENTSIDEFTENVLCKIRKVMKKTSSQKDLFKPEVSQISSDSIETQAVEEPKESLKDLQPSDVESDKQIAVSLLNNQVDEFSQDEVYMQTPNEMSDSHLSGKESNVIPILEKTDITHNEDLIQGDTSDHMDHVTATESDSSTQDIIGPLQLNVNLETESSSHYESNRERLLESLTAEEHYLPASSYRLQKPEHGQSLDSQTFLRNDGGEEKHSHVQQQSPPVPRQKESTQRVKTTRKKSKSSLPISGKQLRDYIKHYSLLNLSKEALKEVEKLSEEYFCQTAHHLEKICKKRKKKVVSANDMKSLLERRQYIPRNKTLSALVRENLPLEYCEEILPAASAGNEVYPKKNKL